MPLSAMLDSKSEPKTIGEEKSSRLKFLNKIASDTINLVEHRLNYASAVSVPVAMGHVYAGPDDDIVKILRTYHDVSESANSLSADIAKVLYPFLCINAVSYDVRLAFWREHVSWADVPLPLMSFLRAKFCDTNWRFVFLKGSEEFSQVDHVKEIYRSRSVGIPRKERETFQGVQSASSASSSTMVSEAATLPPTMDDTTNHDTIGLSADDHAAKADSDVQKSCHYSDAFHNGDTVKPAFAVRMKSKGASPRWRHVCVDCCHWLESQSLLDQYQELDSQPAMESEAATLPATMGDTAKKNTIDLTVDDHAVVRNCCHYTGARHNGNAVEPAFAVRMKSRSSPRWRHVCVECLRWMESESLLDEYHELE